MTKDLFQPLPIDFLKLSRLVVSELNLRVNHKLSLVKLEGGAVLYNITFLQRNPSKNVAEPLHNTGCRCCSVFTVAGVRNWFYEQ